VAQRLKTMLYQYNPLKMRYIYSLILLASLVGYGCKKLDSAPAPNYDAANNIFRVVVDSDQKFDVLITQVRANNSSLDTLNSQSTSKLEFSYGFTAQVGNKITVQVNSPLATNLTCEIYYKGIQVGPDLIDKTSTGVTVNYTYTITK
jgi:hypothetical protein